MIIKQAGEYKWRGYRAIVGDELSILQALRRKPAPSLESISAELPERDDAIVVAHATRVIQLQGDCRTFRNTPGNSGTDHWIKNATKR